jgi:hypothetical protein
MPWPKCDICKKEFLEEDAIVRVQTGLIYIPKDDPGDYEITLTDEKLILVHDACYWIGKK